MIYTLVLIAHTQNHTAHKIQGMVNLARIYMCSKAMKSVQFWVTLLLVLCQRLLYSQWFCLNKQNPVYRQKGSPHLQFSPKKKVSFRAEVGSNFKCKSAQERAQDCVSLERAYGKFVGELLGTPATLIGAFEGLDGRNLVVLTWQCSEISLRKKSGLIFCPHISLRKQSILRGAEVEGRGFCDYLIFNLILVFLVCFSDS